MDNYTFEIDVNGSVFIYNGHLDAPSIYQPQWPDGTPWGKGEAEAWAKQYIRFATNPTADLPGDSPSAPTKPR